MHVNNAKEPLKLVHTGPIFSEPFSKISNCSQYSISANFLPKIGTVTPEDINFPKMAEAASISEIGIALILTYLLGQTIFPVFYFLPYGSCELNIKSF